MMTTDRDNFIEFWTEDNGSAPAYQHWAICGTCKGEGTCAVEALRTHAFTESERAEMGDEWYDFMENYRNGVYDEPCPECSGTGKVREFTGPAAEAWSEWQREAAADAHTRWAEAGYPQ